MEQLLNKLKKTSQLEESEYVKLLKDTYHNLDFDDKYNLCLSSICHISNNLPNNNRIQYLLHDCIVKSRVFLYNDMLKKLYSEDYNLDFSWIDSIAKNFYTSWLDNTTLTKDQKDIFDLFQTNRKIVISAPTSFWKSKIIDEIIIHNDYKNIAVILPTIALLNETYFRFNWNKLIRNNYNFINSLTIKPKEKNIFIFTPEKMDLFLDENPEYKIDFFVMDEIYNIDQDEERWEVFTNCLYKLSKQNSDFYLIWPYFEKFSENYLKKFWWIFKKYDTEIVQKDFYKIYALTKWDKLGWFKKNIDIDTDLKNLLKELKWKSLIYVWNKYEVETKAKNYAKTLPITNYNKDLHKYISENISSEWQLLNCLEKGVAFHHAWIPKYIQVEILNEFNKWRIDYLFCTTTIIEWINTTAKNVIIYSSNKWKKDLRWFDVKNIQWRAWRFLEHFIWNVYYLKSVEVDNISEINFDYLDNKQLSSNKIILVDDDDLDELNKNKKNSLIIELLELNIPLELLKSNKYISYNWQIDLIQYLRNLKISELDSITFDSNIPKQESFDRFFRLIHDFLFASRYQNDKNFMLQNLIYHTYWYILSWWKNIKIVISEMNWKTIDTRIRVALKLINDYFEFSLPKYFRSFEKIFNFVYKEKTWIDNKLNLSYIITLLEYWCFENHEIILKEMWVPIHIVKKITHLIKWKDDLKDIKNKLNKIDLTKFLDSYEIIILNRYI